MINITLIRHWEADGNVRWVLMWWKEWSFLTEKWKLQVQKLWIFLKKYKKIDVILSSPVERAKQTAIILKKYIKSNIIYFDELREIDWGDKTWFFLSDIPSEISEQFLANPYEFAHTNGESMKELFLRVWNFCRNNFSNYENKNIAIVSHDNVIKWIIAYMKNLEKEALNLKIENASYINYDFDGVNFYCNEFNYKI